MATTVTNSIPSTLNDILVKLRILSMIERGKKINMGTMTFTDAASWVGALTRSLNGEGRKGLMVQLNQIIQQAIGAINEYQNTEFRALIVNHLAKAKIGIQNLTTTYDRDPSILGQLYVCIENIDLQLDKNQDLLEGHQPVKSDGGRVLSDEIIIEMGSQLRKLNAGKLNAEKLNAEKLNAGKQSHSVSPSSTGSVYESDE